MRRKFSGVQLISLSSLLFGCLAAGAADWPQWLGPNRNGVCGEKNLLTSWPKNGPKVLWKVKGGDGYSTIAVVGNRAYTLVQRSGKEWAIALNAKNGKQLWQTPLGPAYKNDYGSGPRSTPTVEKGRVYVQSVTGPLVCLNADSGKIIWQHHLLKEFKIKNITWGLSSSPLVDGHLVFAIPGAKNAAVAAFDKKTGDLVWKTGSAKAAYSSPVAVNVGGMKQIVFFNAAGLLAVEPKTGKKLWHIPWKTEFDCNICTPLVLGDRLFVTSGEKVGCAMLQLSASGPPDTDWKSGGRKSVMMNYWANSVYHDGYLYGLSGEFNKRVDLHCVNAKTGKLKWSKPGFGLGAMTLADGHLFITTKKGDLVLVEATPKGYDQKSRISLLGTNRTAPTISNGRMFLRDLQYIYCLDIAKRK